MIICSPLMSIEGSISTGNFLLQTIVACKKAETHTYFSHIGYSANISLFGIFNSNFLQSGVQFEVNNCQQALILCQYPFRYFIPHLF